MDYLRSDDSINDPAFNMAARFSHQVLRAPEAPALWVDGASTSYGVLEDQVRRVAGWLAGEGVQQGARVGVLAARGVSAIAGILGASWAGCTWVPLNPAHPQERLQNCISRAELDALIVDEAGFALLDRLETPGRVLGPDVPLVAPIQTPPAACAADDVAYLMFTSGTTGMPKGVMISQGAIEHFIAVMQERYSVGPSDRVSQFFELTFDLSVFDLFMALGHGACLHVLPESARLGPAAFIQEQRLTVWFSVPSAAVLMHRFGQLRPDAFPELRLSLFCGEPLPAEPVRNWLAAAPESVVENLYGPTEATLACLLQPCTEDLAVTDERGCVAIGQPYPEMRAAILSLDEAVIHNDDQPGELLLAGPQLADGYWRDQALTAERFIQLDGVRWYRTGDLARQDKQGRFHHLGRTDNQVKIFGHRVELEDIDAHLRKASGVDSAMAVAWPLAHGSAQGVVAFVAGSELDAATIRARMKERVPQYMVPRQVKFLEALPLNANGKFDRKALLAMLDRPNRGGLGA